MWGSVGCHRDQTWSLGSGPGYACGVVLRTGMLRCALHDDRGVCVGMLFADHLVQGDELVSFGAVIRDDLLDGEVILLLRNVHEDNGAGATKVGV